MCVEHTQVYKFIHIHVYMHVLKYCKLGNFRIKSFRKINFCIEKIFVGLSGYENILTQKFFHHEKGACYLGRACCVRLHEFYMYYGGA